MNSSEHDINQLLATLRDAQPSTGFEQRILRATARRAETLTTSSFPWLLALGAATAVAAVVLAISLGHTSPATTTHPSRLIPQTSRLDRSIPTVLSSQASLYPVKNRSSRPQRVAPPIFPSALATTAEQNHPAPPAPLTEQEKLLLRVAQPGQPVQVAELDPLREPALRQLSEARTKSILEHYVQRMLAPIVFSESIRPTPPEPEPASQDIAIPVDQAANNQ